MIRNTAQYQDKSTPCSGGQSSSNSMPVPRLHFAETGNHSLCRISRLRNRPHFRLVSHYVASKLSQFKIGYMMQNSGGILMPCILVVCFCLFTAAFWPSTALAYIDPGTGSILIQGIIAAIAAIGVALKLYWHRLVAFFRRKPTPYVDPEQSLQRKDESEHGRRDA